jgi:hypothetical protein
MNVKMLKPYGSVKSYGDFIIVSDVNSKAPLQNFNGWKSFYNWLKVNNIHFKGNLIFKN